MQKIPLIPQQSSSFFGSIQTPSEKHGYALEVQTLSFEMRQSWLSIPVICSIVALNTVDHENKPANKVPNLELIVLRDSVVPEGRLRVVSMPLGDCKCSSKFALSPTK